MRLVLRVASALSGAALCGALVGCGGSSDDDEPEVKSATDQQIEQYAKSATADVQKIAAKVSSAYEKDGHYPKSADGLVKLAKGNEIEKYTSTSKTSLNICVQHVEKQPNPDNTKEVIDLPLAAAEVNVSADVQGNVGTSNPGISKRDGC